VDLGRSRAPALTTGRRADAKERPSRRLLPFAAVFVLFALPSHAGAATVGVDGSVVRLVAAPGELNRVSVAPAADPALLLIADGGAPLVAGPGCAASDTAAGDPSVSHGGVTCVTPENPAIDVLAGDGDDSVAIGFAEGGESAGGAGVPVAAYVDGGAGHDVIEVANGVTDSVWCGRGRDSVIAETRDFLERGCERVDYGATGSVGRIRWRAGGGRLVPVPGQTWALVDRRILPDVLYLIRRYRVRIAEGYGTVNHTPFGEHPLGLAVDIEPGAGGTWSDVSRAARWAEPRQNRPRRPFRWVGWNGDYNHGHPSVCKPRRGCPPHLHLSWSHSPTLPRRIARTVSVFDVLTPAP
jgi:hypothetical protein